MADKKVDAKAGMNNYQVFPREYFSGIDCYISFDNVPIDEIVTMQFSLQEPIVPIYGYASYTYDAVAHGSRIVTGSFRINFKESLYIKSALIKLGNAGISSAAPKKPTANMNTTELLAWMKGKSFSEIEDLADAYSEKMWAKAKDTVINRQHIPFFTGAGTALSNYGFDIILSYGNELIEIGKKLDELPGTVKFINGVHLTGVTQVVQPSGEPIFEEYSFIAKDLDDTI
jgi:hypothetical protein